MRAVFVSLVILIFCISKVTGQVLPDSTGVHERHVFINVKYHYGVVIPHHSSMAYMIEDYSRGVELNVGRSNFGKDNWEKYFNYPEIGIGIFYITLGNNEVYGESLSVFPYVNFNIIRSAKFSATYKVAWGVGYVNRPYSDENNTNMAIGSHFNAYIGLGLLADYRLSKHWSLSGTWTLNHLSNGSEKKPNQGINLTTLGIGVKYHFNEQLYPKNYGCLIPEEKRFELLTVAYGARNESGLYYNVSTAFSGGITNTILYHQNAKRAFGAGIDLRYYGGAPYAYEGNFVKSHYDFNDYLYSSVFLAIHKKMGELALYFHLGAYVTSGVKPTQPVYPRIGIQYNLNKNLVAHFGLKASFFAAEYIELGLGYRFNLEKKVTK